MNSFLRPEKKQKKINGYAIGDYIPTENLGIGMVTDKIFETNPTTAPYPNIQFVDENGLIYIVSQKASNDSTVYVYVTITDSNFNIIKEFNVTHTNSTLTGYNVIACCLNDNNELVAIVTDSSRTVAWIFNINTNAGSIINTRSFTATTNYLFNSNGLYFFFNPTSILIEVYNNNFELVYSFIPPEFSMDGYTLTGFNKFAIFGNVIVVQLNLKYNSSGTYNYEKYFTMDLNGNNVKPLTLPGDSTGLQIIRSPIYVFLSDNKIFIYGEYTEKRLYVYDLDFNLVKYMTLAYPIIPSNGNMTWYDDFIYLIQSTQRTNNHATPSETYFTSKLTKISEDGDIVSSSEEFGYATSTSNAGFFIRGNYKNKFYLQSINSTPIPIVIIKHSVEVLK